MSKLITVDIDAAGAVTIETSGYRGPECEQATRELERALGRASDNVRKPEYHSAMPKTVQRQGR